MKKQEIERISEKLTAKRRLVWDALDQKDKGDVWEFDRQYRDFLNSAKTEREA
ncbi:MAG: aminopeptidase, partial [Deltaproteobacteria bacterium]|nr:aminopeptidase [Deltaproteobacteria bacterium]